MRVWSKEVPWNLIRKFLSNYNKFLIDLDALCRLQFFNLKQGTRLADYGIINVTIIKTGHPFSIDKKL